MLQDILLTPDEIALKAEVREFVKEEVSSDLIGRWTGTRSPIRANS